MAAPEKKVDDDDIVLAPSSKEKKAAASENADTAKDKPVKQPVKSAGNARQASPLYLVLGLITLVLMLAVTVLTATQFLDFEQHLPADQMKQIYDAVPGLPHAKAN